MNDQMSFNSYIEPSLSAAYESIVSSKKKEARIDPDATGIFCLAEQEIEDSETERRAGNKMKELKHGMSPSFGKY